jgi:uncharacterized protein YggE
LAVAADDRTVTVDGHAELRTAPDRATLRMGVEARADDVETARKTVAETVNRFLKLTRDMGIPDDRVSTASAIVRPDYDWNPQTRERRLLGYVVTRQLEVEIHELEKLGRLTESALRLGVNQVNPPTLDTSRRDALELEALAEAARDARSRAGSLAEALGAGLGDVRTIQASSAFRPPVPLARGMLAAEADAAEETYQPGEITISGSVTATFDLILP